VFVRAIFVWAPAVFQEELAILSATVGCPEEALVEHGLVDRYGAQGCVLWEGVGDVGCVADLALSGAAAFIIVFLY